MVYGDKIIVVFKECIKIYNYNTLEEDESIGVKDIDLNHLNLGIEADCIGTAAEAIGPSK